MTKLNGLSAAVMGLALGALVLSFPAAAQTQEFAPFWKDFAAAAKAGDKAKVRGVMKFPFLYLSDLREENAFEEIWKGLFTAKVRTCLGKGKPMKDKRTTSSSATIRASTSRRPMRAGVSPKPV